MRPAYTTGQVARICGVATRTVEKWLDNGVLLGYRIPCSRFRRVPRETLRIFVRDNGLPMDALDEEAEYQLLLVGAGSCLLERLGQLLPADEGYCLRAAADAFMAGMQMQARAAGLVLLDCAMGRSEALAVARHLAARVGTDCPLLLVLADEDEPEGALWASCCDHVWQKPLDVALLAECIRAHFLPGRGTRQPPKRLKGGAG